MEFLSLTKIKSCIVIFQLDENTENIKKEKK